MKEKNQSTKNLKELYFHVGLAKTGSTYLQNKFFHKLKGIKYIHTSEFYKYNEIISSAKEEKLLFSREFDRQFFDETLKIAEKYPDAKIIIVLRSNEKWIASQYRRYVKNGGSRSFKKFIDIEKDKGVWKIEDAFFVPKLKFLETHFANKPLILFYEEFKESPHKVFQKIADYTGTEYKKEEIDLKPKHKSYSDKQLLFVRNITRKFYKKEPPEFSEGKVSWLKFRLRWLILHLFLYLAKIAYVKSEKNLIPKTDLETYKEFYKEDWNNCKKIAEKISAL